MKYLFLAFALLCSSCAFTLFYNVECIQQEVKEPVCDWKQAYAYAKNGHKHVRLSVELNFKNPTTKEYTDIILKDGNKEYVISTVITYGATPTDHVQKFVFDLGGRLKELHRSPSDKAVFVLKSKADVTLVKAKVEFVEVKK